MKRNLIIITLLMASRVVFALTYNVTVPAGTKACYIAGEMNNWSQQPMSKVDETHYTLEIATATITNKYKYCSGPTWTYVEDIADNRSYTANDVVSSWAAIYDPAAVPQDVTFTVTVPENTNTCYFVGKVTGWVFKPMSRIDNTHFSIIINTTMADGYKYCSGPDWAYEELDANNQTIPDRNYSASDVVAKWKQVYYSGPSGLTYNVTVPSGTPACFITGDMNNWGFTPMTKTDDTHFMLNIPSASTYQNYLYCSGPDISYKELNSAGITIPSRMYTSNDVVARWSAVFTPLASVTLTSSTARQSYECQTVLPITWTSVNVQNVNIYFSGDYGLNWSEIASSVPASSGSFNYTLPADAVYECKIKISDASNSMVSSVSDGMFVVYNHLPEKVDPLLRSYYQTFTYPYNAYYPVTDPTDSEIINGRVGNACGPTGVTNILSYWEFPRKGFGSRTFTDIKNCTWSANFAEADYKYDLSSDKLTTNSPQAEIDANATLMYHAATGMHNIYRSGNSVDVLNAFKQYFGFNSGTRELNRDNYTPQQWEKIMKSELSLGRPQLVQGWSKIFSDGNYEGHWFMCDGYSADNLFHISLDYGQNSIKYCPLYEFDSYKLKNWIFAYLKPEKNGKNISLTYPTGNEFFKQGAVKNITWNSTGVSNINIEFSDNGGNTWTVIGTNIAAAAGTYGVTIPAALSDNCKIRISDAADINIYSRNRVPFSVYDSKELGLTSVFPSALQSNVIFPVRWTSKGVNTVSLEYTINNGQNWTLMAERPGGEGVYKWTVPVTTASSCKIRITDKSDNTVTEESPAFAIGPDQILGGPYANDNNTVALYHFDGDYQNLSNNQLAANPVNTVSLGKTGLPGMDYGARTDNSNPSISSCIEIPHETPLNLVNDWTIEFWFKINSWGGVTTMYPYLLIKPGANYFVFLDVAARSLHVGYDYEGGAENLFLPNNILELNKWYHIIFTRNTANTTLNCQLHDARRNLLSSESVVYQASHIPKTSTNQINLGGFGGGSNVQFDGYVDELRISNVVRNLISTGIKDQNKPDMFSVYPNPSTGKFVISFEPSLLPGSVLRVFNIQGNTVYSSKPASNEALTLDLSGYQKGIYLIQLNSGNEVRTRKLIIK